MTEAVYQKIIGKFKKQVCWSESYENFCSGANVDVDAKRVWGIRYYTGQAGFMAVNSLLYKKNYEFENGFELEDAVRSIYWLTKNFEPIAKKSVAYRGTTTKHFPDVDSFDLGTQFPINGFGSASKNYTIAIFYARYMRKAMLSEPIVFEIEIPKGMQCCVVDKNSSSYNEWEIILPPANFEVRNIKKRGREGERVVSLRLMEIQDIKKLTLEGLDYVLTMLKRNKLNKSGITAEFIDELKEKVLKADFSDFKNYNEFGEM